MYKDRNSGMSLFQLPAIDFSVIAAMFLLVVLAWGVAKMEKSFTKVERQIPVFTVTKELSVMPIVEAKTKKEAVKVGRFMSLAKTSEIPAAKSAEFGATNTEVLKKIVLAQKFPATSTLTAPKVIYKSMPDYPVKAIENGVHGSVLVKVYILKNGRVGEAVVDQTSGHEVLDKSAAAAVSQWIFEPALYAKDATEAWFKIPIKFELKS